LRRKQVMPARLGLLFAGLYLLVGWTQHDRAWNMVEQAANARGHVIEKGLVKPTIGNVLTWRSIYQYKDRLYIDGVRVGILSEPKFYQGANVALFNPEEEFKYMPRDLVLYQDILRFVAFSKGYVSIHPDTPNVLGDMRYANNPLGIKPLWGIEMDLRNPQYHAKYKFYRDLSKTNRQTYFDMLLGRDIKLSQ
ncbi:MAG: metal-dependent hydrolase, partial [Gammaproteobacteria bacterium]|nr:metal-dependent hydrolase [Gammaproteobacteria bacterium]